MRRKLFALVLVLVVCLSQAVSVFAFDDVSEDAWCAEEIEYAYNNGIVFGTTPSTFEPDEPVSKEQIVDMMGRAFGSMEFEEVLLGSGVLSAGWQDPISVAQLAYVLDNYIRYAGIELISYEPIEIEYKAEDWAIPSMERILWYGLIHVEDDLNAGRAATRAEAVYSLVSLIWRMEDSVSVATYGDYGDLLPDDYFRIEKHALDDNEAIDNNIRYVLKNGLYELLIDTDEFGDSELMTGSAYGDAYWTQLTNYPEFGLKYVWTEQRDGWLCIEFTGFPKEYELLEGYQSTALEAAMKVQSELYECGALSEDMLEREKARVYFDWLVDHCEYDWVSFYGQSRLPFAWMAYGPLIRGSATCQGYTAVFNLFMRLEGIECATERTEHHIWSVANLDGVDYHIDATYSDMCQVDREPYFCMPDGSLVETYVYDAK